ncbi:ABC transporter permease [Paenibacillus filicis]|uniref:ABC transporter permease n=1 Tax=Paenibacillus gyeongsangnamensis TaxID=3388067 RepID=A0ABT4QKE5_9BACL|nr:ABC transporter permease [Paenibacillus filicis]MCZ8517343.1 ABC transporter permease [Paenibacillus filicis]
MEAKLSLEDKKNAIHTLAVDDNTELKKDKYEILLHLFRRKSVIFGLGIIIIIIGMTVFAPFLTSWDPNAMKVEERLMPPSSIHIFGTDAFGRDMFSRVANGGKVSLVIGAFVVIFAVGGGTLLGLLSGYFRWLDNVLMRLMDGLMAFPGLMLAVAMMGLLGPSSSTVVIALSIVYMPRVARVVRGSVLVIREYPFIEAEITLGARSLYILFVHILPNCLSPIIIQCSFIFSYAVLGEAALSFLGVGVPPTIPSWGNILSDSRVYIVQAWWIAVFPGIAIMLTVLGLNLFGDGLRDMMDPKLRKL